MKLNLLALILFSSTSFALTNSDSNLHKSSARPIISQIVGGVIGAPGKIANGISNFIAENKFHARDGFKKSKYVYQCSAPLPATQDKFPINDATQAYHTWLEVGVDSYGMPHTLSGTYFGGQAVIKKPDPFLYYTNRTKTCQPIFMPSEKEQLKYADDFKCIADKLSVENTVLEKVLQQDSSSDIVTVLFFDYNALTNNCLSAVKFITECADGRISQNPNFGVGSDIDAENLQETGFNVQDRNILKNINALFLSVDEAYPKLDLKTLKEGFFKCDNKCELLKNKITETLLKIQKDLFTNNDPFLVDVKAFIALALKQIKNEEDLYRLKRMTDTLKDKLMDASVITVIYPISKKQACENARRSCGL